MFLENNEIVHIRPSGNSPEIRVYVESDTLIKAKKLTENTLNNISLLAK